MYDPECHPNTLIVFWNYDNIVGCLWAELESINYEAGAFRPKGYGSSWGMKALVAVLPQSMAGPIIHEMEALLDEQRAAKEDFRRRGKNLLARLTGETESDDDN